MFIRDDEKVSQFDACQVIKSNNLNKEQQEIVEKVIQLNEGAEKYNSNSNNKLNYLLSGAKELELSENTIKALEGYQFGVADVNAVDPLLGNSTLGTLGMIIQEVGSSVKKDGILSMMFPDKAVPTYKVLLDRIAPNAGILPEFGGDSNVMPSVRPLDTYLLEYKGGLWGAKVSLHAHDIAYARERGAKGFDLRGIGQLTAYNTVNLVTQAMTRKKKLLVDAIFNNGFTYNGASVGSNIPSGNSIAISSMGTLNANGSVTYSNADPLYNPIQQITNIIDNPLFLKYRAHIKGILLNTADLRAIMNHPNVKAVSNYFMATGVSLGTKKINVQIGEFSKDVTAYYAPSFDVPFIADDEVYIQSNVDGTKKTTPNDATNSASAQQYFIPRGKMLVLLDLSSTGGVAGGFHLTYNEIDPNTTAPAMGLYTGVFNRNLHNSDNTVNRLDIVASLSGGPAIYMPEAIFTITSLYSS